MSTSEERFEPADVESVMADYLQRIEQGESPDPADYLQRFPAFAKDLRTFFCNHHWIDGTAPTDPSETLIGKSIGPYVIESEIARGGMGVVYRAHQTGLDRAVALKLIGSGVLASREERKRFRIEAEAAAKLQHPGIVAIYEIGSWEGHEYFSMALVDGPTLQQKIDSAPLPIAESVELMIAIAEAVAFAHRAGVLHRDLKPDNVLLCQDGRPLLSDFGLAKWHKEGTLMTQTGQVLGSPHYMSPEQAIGKNEITAQSDVYSLGAIFYTLLTRSPPHHGDSPGELLHSVLHDDPISPRLLNRDIPVPLEKICLQAMVKEIGGRYPSADALIEDLERFRSGSPVMAQDNGLLGQVARELRRDQHQNFFSDWSRSLLIIGLIIFCTHAAITVGAWLDLPAWLSFGIPRVLLFVAIAGVIYFGKEGRILPRTSAERPVYSIWIGYLLSLGSINLLTLMQVIPTHAQFPITSILSGFGFLAMSGHVWGSVAMMGAAFFAASLLMPWIGNGAPLLFGSIWLVNLWTLSRHYRNR